MRPLSLYGSAVLAVLTAVFLSACGQKGALYLPEPTVTQPNPTTQNTTSSTPTAPNQTGVAP
ncbi:MAG: lipoprotein [Moraxellaceae bacterium]